MDLKYYDLLHSRERSRSFMSQEYVERADSSTLFVYVVRNRALSGSVEIDNRIDEESKIILHTFNKELSNVYAAHMSRPVPMLSLSKPTQTVEFSSLIHSLAKIMEIELNNSIVQYIRLLKGIEMPQYYNRIKPDFRAFVQIPGMDACDVNGSRNGELKSQTIGSIKLLIESCEEELDPLFDGQISEFLPLWKNIHKKRNDSSHTSIISEEEFLSFYDSFCAIARDGWLRRLMDIKEQLKG